MLSMRVVPTAPIWIHVGRWMTASPRGRAAAPCGRGRPGHAECQRRRAVGDEIDPQDLRREERQERLAARRKAEHTGEHRGREDGEHLAGLGPQQIPHEGADVLEDAAPQRQRGVAPSDGATASRSCLTNVVIPCTGLTP